MARIPYASSEQFAELMLKSGFPGEAPKTNAFLTLAHTPVAGAAALRLVFALLTETKLDPKLREIVILRIAQQCEGKYVWDQHVPIAKAAGVTERQIAALERGMVGDVFSERESLAIAFADKALRGSGPSDRAFAAVRNMLSASEIVELLLLVGYFRMMSGLLTVLGVETEHPFGQELLKLAV